MGYSFIRGRHEGKDAKDANTTRICFHVDFQLPTMILIGIVVILL